MEQGSIESIETAKNPWELALNIRAYIDACINNGETFRTACKKLEENGISQVKEKVQILKLRSQTTQQLAKINSISTGTARRIVQAENKLGEASPVLEERMKKIALFLEDLEPETASKILQDRISTLIQSVLVDQGLEEKTEASDQENPIEKAKKYLQKEKELNLNSRMEAIEQIAKEEGSNTNNIFNHLKLLELPDKIRELISRGTLTFNLAATKLVPLIRSEIYQFFEHLAVLIDEYSSSFISNKEKNYSSVSLSKAELKMLISKAKKRTDEKPTSVPSKKDMVDKDPITKARIIREIMEKQGRPIPLRELGEMIGMTTAQVSKLLRWLKEDIPPRLTLALERKEISERAARQILLPLIKDPENIEKIIETALRIENPANARAIEEAIRELNIKDIPKKRIAATPKKKKRAKKATVQADSGLHKIIASKTMEAPSSLDSTKIYIVEGTENSDYIHKKKVRILTTENTANFSELIYQYQVKKNEVLVVIIDDPKSTPYKVNIRQLEELDDNDDTENPNELLTKLRRIIQG